jgi:phytoene dehydrogenase-like protein
MMTQNRSDNYDVIIIGAGIGGLVCGCYLARAGMKVLIVEQHYKPGGYCSSFKRNGFTFDAAAHSFGGYREQGIVRKVLTDLGIDKKLKIVRYNPSDIIKTPDGQVSFYSELSETVSDFGKSFPDERTNIRNFFSFLCESNRTFFMRARKWTFDDLLNSYFHDPKLKSIFSFLLLGNGGLPSSLISAFVGTNIIREFLIDGGYYPKGGMQSLSDMLSRRFMEYGGKLRMATKAEKIVVKNGIVTGVRFNKNLFCEAKFVVSNCDARQTFLKLLGSQKISAEIRKKLSIMIPSLSMIVLYLGIDAYYRALPKRGCNIWFLPHYAVEDMYNSAKRRNLNNLEEYMVRFSPEGKTILGFINSSFKARKYWLMNKSKFIESFIGLIEEHTIPDLSDHIVYKDAATPWTLYRYTLNSKGAAYGWTSTPAQVADTDFRRPSFLRGFYLTGHWATQGLGIPGVTYLGYDTAHNIIRRKSNRKLI